MPDLRMKLTIALTTMIFLVCCFALVGHLVLEHAPVLILIYFCILTVVAVIIKETDC